jgi:MATE family multidrug resistance protein
VGRGDLGGVARVASSALACGVGFMTCTAIAFTLAPAPFASLYTLDPAVRATAMVLLPLAGVFQVFDGAQVVCGGVLRGMGETRIPMIANAVGYWALGLPFGLWLGFGLRLGGRGLWWGLVVGLAAVAMFLLTFLRLRLRSRIDRLRVEAAPAAHVATH